MKYAFFRGAPYRHDWVTDLTEDLGGFVISKDVLSTEARIMLAIPDEDMRIMEDMVKKVAGEIETIPLATIEVVLVAPSFSHHHAPLPICSMVESLRRLGAKADMIALERGFGRRARLTPHERDTINEHDIAIFLFGCFKECILNYKLSLLNEVTIPSIIVGYPESLDVPGAAAYTGGLSRLPMTFRKGVEVETLRRFQETVIKVAEKLKSEGEYDPPLLLPVYVGKEIEKKLSFEKVLTTTPITYKVDGLRVRLPYDTAAGELTKILLSNQMELGSVAKIIKSYNGEIIVKPLKESKIASERVIS